MSVAEKIETLRRTLGGRLTIMGHHYQHQSVIDHTDLRGDSLELARKAAGVTSDYIVFCGVFFMAESAALLARPGQTVCIPDPSADCSMALMAPAKRVRRMLELLGTNGRKIIPLAYVNSSLEVKAVVGEYGGAVCTSANAKTMLRWAMEQGDAVLFLPDKCLGANTAKLLGVPEEAVMTLDIRADGKHVDLAEADKARLLLWPGHCCIHTRFTLEQMAAMRAAHPGARIVVHPESLPAIVDAADAAGSTSFIIDYVGKAKAGETIVIGTEVNLVKRLAVEHAGRVTVLPLLETECSHMARTTEENLLEMLESIAAGKPLHVVQPDTALFAPAKAALERMLTVCA